jgi:hypothetical protein
MSLTAPNHVSHPQISHPRVTVLAPTAFNVQSPHIPPPPPYRRVLSLLPRIRVMGHARRRREDEDRSELDRASEEELDGSTKRSSMRTEPRTVPEKRRRGRWPASPLELVAVLPLSPMHPPKTASCHPRMPPPARASNAPHPAPHAS